MGKITNALSKFGGAVSKAVKSNTAKKIFKAAIDGAGRVAQSELGQRAISGLIEGAATAALTDGSYGEEIKRAVILNVAGVSDVVTDPLNPIEHALAQKVNRIDKVIRSNADIDKYGKVLKKIDGIGTELTKVEKYLQISHETEISEQEEIEALEAAMKAMGMVVGEEKKNLAILERALRKEERMRSADEKRMIEYMKRNYEHLAEIANKEKESIIEEALEQTIDIGGEIAEHLAAEVPLVGEGVAAGMATARGAVQIYKLGKVISELTNTPIHHVELPMITPEGLQVLYEESDPTEDQNLLRIVSSKLKHVEEVDKEVVHLAEKVVPVVVKQAATDSLELGGSGKGVPMRTRASNHVPRNQRPAIHFYTAPWDSDFVIIFHVIAPYSSDASFMLALDLATDYVGYYDIYKDYVSECSEIDSYFNLQHAVDDFLIEASAVGGSTEIHAERLQRGVGTSAIYVGSQEYRVSFEAMREHAKRIVQDPSVQMHLLRGPLSMQRTSLLNALMHGITILSDTPTGGMTTQCTC
ncbi:VP5 protein [Corriparta virus]|uniref:Outer capsid protein VP5 n=1 Tax=Corriparta virus TaxID=40053 RepID=T1SRC7_9REOV|nr:VP5 protein [Corriparta virus]AGT51059.1 VP5 protein [Corriparta virus]